MPLASKGIFHSCCHKVKSSFQKNEECLSLVLDWNANSSYSLHDGFPLTGCSYTAPLEVKSSLDRASFGCATITTATILSLFSVSVKFMHTSEIDPPRLLPDLDIERFVRVQDLEVNNGYQETEYERAIRELRQGEKRSDWILFVFPRVSGLGKHINSIFYGIATMEEARAYLSHPVLGPRLYEAIEAVLESGEDDLSKLFCNSDESRFKSSMTLFAQVCLGSPEEVFLRVIMKFWGGVRDERTLRIMDSW